MNEINPIAVLICGIFAMGLGTFWYGPLFGEKWLKIIGMKRPTPEEMKDMQKKMIPVYLTQFLLVLFQVSILAYFINQNINADNILKLPLLVWAGFILPTIAAASLWDNDSKSVAWSKFLIQTGYNLVLFISFAFILTI